MSKIKLREWVTISLLIVLAAALLLAPSTKSSEIDKILALKSVPKQSEELLKLLDRVGPVEAQEQMLSSGLPFTGETHLLIHTVGDYIYEKSGLDGLPMCRDYFLSACYHGFIINVLGDLGLEGMADVLEKCNTAPPGVASQCAHAAGHGFVAWHDYDLIKALNMCDELGGRVDSPAGEFGYFNCYDGVFMENFWGVHSGEPSEKRWVSETDIYYPCTDDRIPEKYLKGCWANQATSIYQHYKGDLRKTAEACDAVENKEYLDACYNNLFRQIHPLTAGDKEKVFSLCANATGKDRQDECVLTNMVSYWSVGDREIPFEICGSLSGEVKDGCLNRLSVVISYSYSRDPESKKFYCGRISSKMYRNRCLGEQP